MRTDVELPRVLIPSVAGDLGISDARTRAELRRGKCRTIARRAVLTRPEEPTRADWAALGIALGGPTGSRNGAAADRGGSCAVAACQQPTPAATTVRPYPFARW
jgi:hypothetical protein